MVFLPSSVMPRGAWQIALGIGLPLLFSANAAGTVLIEGDYRVALLTAGTLLLAVLHHVVESRMMRSFSLPAADAEQLIDCKSICRSIKDARPPPIFIVEPFRSPGSLGSTVDHLIGDRAVDGSVWLPARVLWRRHYSGWPPFQRFVAACPRSATAAYAMKACPAPAVLSVIRRRGFDVEVNSVTEYRRYRRGLYREPDLHQWRGEVRAVYRSCVGERESTDQCRRHRRDRLDRGACFSIGPASGYSPSHLPRCRRWRRRGIDDGREAANSAS